MQIANASSVRENLFNIIADVAKNDPILVTSKRGNCIMVSEDEWNSIQESIMLLSNQKVRQDIEEGLKTPLDECLDTLPW